jgi:hypothetical protein
MLLHPLEDRLRRVLTGLGEGNRLLHPALGHVYEPLHLAGRVRRQRDLNVLAPGLQRIQHLPGEVVLGRIQGTGEARQRGHDQ